MISTNERGFTLAEVLVTTAISMAIAGLLGTAIYQFFVVTNQGSDTMTAMHQIQNASHWLNIDGQMSNSANGGSQLELTIPNSATVTYALSGTELRRTVEGSQMTVARNISSIDFSIDGRVITTTITAAPEEGGGISEQGAFKVYLRLSETSSSGSGNGGGDDGGGEKTPLPIKTPIKPAPIKPIAVQPIS
ncbi:MAG: hypothetical protein SVM79_04765 [Chloroflexota bacterium]|nr:hypothetical protein [Chloroflexota bacterium]